MQKLQNVCGAGIALGSNWTSVQCRFNRKANVIGHTGCYNRAIKGDAAAQPSRRSIFKEAIAMTLSRLMKFVTGGMEAFLGIPIIGGLFIIGTGYTPLWVMFVLHIITLLLCSKDKTPGIGSVLGIITSVVAWIPILGMLMHLLTAAVLLLNALFEGGNTRFYTNIRGRRY
ncbi:hypothetical protein [Paenibacillus koleovorans]|uniref:hypothetical protein n=1 Tax=Paenibacillus koleovorans TaxID=121608 RepID=UPI0027D92B65|nr:hypothetical protein [Paenibacillus koleovorans]